METQGLLACLEVLDLLYWSKPSWCDICYVLKTHWSPLLYSLSISWSFRLNCIPTLVWFISTALTFLRLGTELQTLYRTVLVLVLARALKRNRAIRICMDFHEKIYGEGLIHAIAEAEKSHSLPFCKLDFQESQWYSSGSNPKAQEPGSRCPTAERMMNVWTPRRANTLVLPLTFCSGQALNWLDIPPALVRADFLSVSRFKC